VERDKRGTVSFWDRGAGAGGCWLNRSFGCGWA
jgi:hypothetical protein